MARWALEEAQRRLPEIIKATADAPQEIDVGDGEDVILLVRRPAGTRRRHPVDVIMDSPLRDIDLGDDLRDKSLPREIEL